MFAYIVRQLAGLLVTLFLVSVVIMLIFTVIPGDPAALLAGTSADAAQREVLREKLNLDKDIVARYGAWLKSALRADFGESIQYAMPVKTLLVDRLAVTSSIALLAVAIMLIGAIPLGVLAAVKRGSVVDSIIGNAAVVALSVPSYFAGILIIWLCGITLHWFTPGDFSYSVSDGWRYWRSLLFPAIAVALPNAAMMTKFVRMAVSGEFEADYVRPPRSKGAAMKQIFVVHIARNALTPVLTLFGILTAEILSGSIVVEQVFGVPGIGRLLIGAINSRDFPVVITIVLYVSFIVVIINFLVELLSRLNDPRIRIE